MRNGRRAILAGVLVLIGLLGLQTPAFAKKFTVGVKGGGNLATVVGPDVNLGPGRTKQYLPTISGGLQGAFNLGSIGVQTEVLVSERGVKYASEEDPSNDFTTLRAFYLQVPVLFRYNVSIPAVPVTPKAMAGPSVSVFLSGREKQKQKSDVFSADLQPENMRTPHFGAVVGAGVDVSLASFVLTADVRYERGLSKFRAVEEPPAVFYSTFIGHVGLAVGF